ncbi:hypothetical protein SODALDRAFT_328406 [Sodiomyces alkalinus F11]|uniref:Guanine nucleotide-exchange factor SEC12 n=1 Tax=Sodiomyces alkalinus (strain CBS 110278 / VKM F-3762 / F11) TaxID=1314773 RepID=A0A3N2PNK8_SODAK|nr:hypothetical protein SODALDRAFT_328406 [Sodiomyces alkalinus F11]ROT36020.1 hypothetical protein SODALDRAFT_328406 [Sodiomyces alkalinus F11]
MGPPLEVARLTLNYPPYSCDFDPQDATKLLVGGGGGANRSGVANRITAIDTSRNEIRIIGEIDLSRSEDSVNTIAVGQKNKKQKIGPKSAETLVYAGINSNPADVEKGNKNEHFRVFSLSAAATANASDEKQAHAHALNLTELSRTALFEQRPEDKEAYQRLLRLSPLYPDRPQLGAVATGFAKQAQIALFDVRAPAAAAPRPRGVLEVSKEATDLDVVQTGDDSFQVAYCDERQIFVINVNKTDITGPDLVYSMPEDGSGLKPSFRAIRYLSPGFIMAVSNLPKQAGVILSAIRLPSLDKKGKKGKETEARLAASARLPRFMSRATSFAVRNLNPPTTPGGPLGDTQFVIAVAGQQSVCLHSVEHRSDANLDLLVDLLPLATLKDVHQLSITSLALSVFLPPSSPSTSPSSSTSSFTSSLTSSKPAPPGLNLLLASVAMDNSVAVHSIPLKKLAAKPAARYTVAFAPQRTGPRNVIIALTITVLILAAVVQYVISTGIDPALLFPGRPSLARSGDAAASSAGSAGVVTSTTPVPTIEPEVLTPGMFLSRLLPDLPELRVGDIYVLREEDVELEKREGGEGNDDDGGDSASNGAPRRIRAMLHDEEAYGPAAEWEALSAEQKELWKKRLADAGYWAENMGESVFKGVVFGEIARVVEQTVSG